jgi:caa(3)-type oxidase subunit IV
MAENHRKEYWIIFGVLFALTVLEVGVVYVPGIGRGLLVSALVFLALAKAALVMLFFMHLKSETKALKWTAMAPFGLPALYALVLIFEAGWRHFVG